HFGDVPHLAGQVAGHGVDGVGEVLPGAGYAGHDGLAAEFAISTHLARYACHFRGERAELVHHGIDGLFKLQDFATDIDRDLAREVTAGHGDGDLGDVTHLRRQVTGHGVNGVGKVFPYAAHLTHLRL